MGACAHAWVGVCIPEGKLISGRLEGNGAPISARAKKCLLGRKGGERARRREGKT